MDGEPSPDAGPEDAAAGVEGNWSLGVNESEGEWLDYYEEYESDYIKIFVLRWDGRSEQLWRPLGTFAGSRHGQL